MAKEIERLKGELSKIEGEISRANGKLNNKGFTDKAPKALVDAEREKIERYNAMRIKVLDSLKEYGA